ncbi:MAG: hypothetical protein RIS47_1926 [Bacteroidota bacterium]|jgi:predicted Fe-Mo cluster-binding NifX family protein
MKIAIPVTTDGQVDSHFGHCEGYKIYDFNAQNEIVSSVDFASPAGCGCKSDIASVFAEMGIRTLLVGGIGNGAINTLNRFGIGVIKGCSGDVNTLASEFAQGKIVDTGYVCENHGAEGSDHVCSHS